MTFLDSLSKVLPVILLFLLGLFLRQRHIIRPETIADLKTLRTPNKALWWVLGGATLFMGLVLYLPPLCDLFKFAFLHPSDLILCLAAGIFSIGWFEAMKYFTRHKSSPTAQAKIELN